MLGLIHQLAGRPWAIRAEIAAHVRGLIAREGIAGLRHLAELKAIVHAFDEDERPRAARGRGSQLMGTVAVVQIIGTLTQRGDFLNSAPTRSTSAIADEVRAFAADPQVDAIVLEVDSPGGEVYGVPEAWASIRESAKIKPVVASANSLAASAALYLASAATEFWITESGEAGSLGVYALHIDASKALEDMGERWDFIVATDSPYKVEGSPDKPLADDARAWLQKAVDRYMAMFVRDVAKGRGVTETAVRRNFGGGRMLGPQDAVAVRMADHVGTFEQAIRRAAGLGRDRQRESGGSRASVAVAGEPRPVRAGVNDIPGLTEGTADRACANCEHFSQPAPAAATGACDLYDATVDRMWVCDSWEPAATVMAPIEEPEEPPVPPDESAAAATAMARQALSRLRSL